MVVLKSIWFRTRSSLESVTIKSSNGLVNDARPFFCGFVQPFTARHAPALVRVVLLARAVAVPFAGQTFLVLQRPTDRFGPRQTPSHVPQIDRGLAVRRLLLAAQTGLFRHLVRSNLVHLLEC